MTDLIPCPFCGAEVAFINRDYWENITPKPSDARWDIGCGTAGCFLERGADWFCTQAEIIAMWNNRAPHYIERTGEFTVSWNQELDVWELKQDALTVVSKDAET